MKKIRKTPPEYKVGDTVRWTSQGHGSSSRKEGTIVIKIAPLKYLYSPLKEGNKIKKRFPRHLIMFDLYPYALPTGVVYIVEVIEQGGKRPKLYKPRPQWLRLIDKKE